MRMRMIQNIKKAGLMLGGLGLFLASPVLGADDAPTLYRQTEAVESVFQSAPRTLDGQFVSYEESASGNNACGCNNGCGSGCGCMDGELGEPWTLMKALHGDCPPAHTIAGFMQWGWQSNPDGAFTGNGPFLDDHEHKSFNLNQMYLYSEKIADGSEGLGFGYRVDMLYGVDGNEAQSFGNPAGSWDFANGWDHGIYEWAMPQLYAEVATGNLSVKLGHFYTPIGYEVVPSTGNFFLSRQITFYNSEPFTHTGALGNYKVNDNLSLMGGWMFGWDTGFDQLNGGNMGTTGFTYKVNDNASMIYAIGFGEFGWRGVGVINSVIMNLKWTEKVSSVHQFDALQTNNGTDFNVDGITGDSTGFINYLFYEINAKMKAGTRAEWYKADGTSYYTWTYGLNLKPHANVLVRPEVRHMWGPGAQNGAAGSIANNVFDVYGNQTVFGIDTIFTF